MYLRKYFKGEYTQTNVDTIKLIDGLKENTGNFSRSIAKTQNSGARHNVNRKREDGMQIVFV